MNRTIPVLAVIVIALQLTGCMVYTPGMGRLAKPNKIYNEQGTHEFDLGIGAASGTTMVAPFGNSREPYHITASNTGSVVADYKYYVSQKVALGPVAGFQNFSYNWVNDGMAYGKPVYTQSTSLVTLGAELKGIISSTKSFQFYNLIGVGVTFHYDKFSSTPYTQSSYYGVPPDKNYNAFNFQYSIGLQTGNKLCWFLEVGVGYRGLAHTGISYKIPSKHPHIRTDADKYF